MNKFIILTILYLSFSNLCFAGETEEIQSFFNNYVNAANSYSCDYFDYYSENPRIIRVVEKPDGSKEAVTVPFEIYKNEAKKSTKLMKLRQYKNRYFNVKITKHGKDYKVAALRMPSTSDYKIPAHFIIGKDDCGNWKIKEESMNTKVQKFLKNS